MIAPYLLTLSTQGPTPSLLWQVWRCQSRLAARSLMSEACQAAATETKHSIWFMMLSFNLKKSQLISQSVKACSQSEHQTLAPYDFGCVAPQGCWRSRVQRWHDPVAIPRGHQCHWQRACGSLAHPKKREENHLATSLLWRRTSHSANLQGCFWPVQDNEPQSQSGKSGERPLHYLEG